jgi:signal peptidase I
MDKINIFISHHHDDEKYIEDFKAKIGDHFEIRDSSIVESEPNNAKNPDYIKSEYLKPSIDWAGKMIVFVGDKIKDSDWVKWEIEYANSKGYPIIAVYLPNATEADNPQCLEDYSDNFVNWNDIQKIIDAINGIIVSDGSDGNVRPSSSGGGVIC